MTYQPEEPKKIEPPFGPQPPKEDLTIPLDIEATQKLINQLGDPNYQLRELTEQLLIALDTKAIQLLRENEQNPDAEIRQRIRFILSRLTDVRPLKGNVPEIWFLPPELRWETNKWHEETKSYDNDIALLMYNEQYCEERDNQIYQWPSEWGVGGRRQSRLILYNFQKTGDAGYTDWKAPYNALTARYATINYMTRWRYNGGTRKEIQEVYDKMAWRKDNMEFVEEDILSLETFGDLPPRCLIIKTQRTALDETGKD
jgi:hypothetical protein